MFYGEYQEHPVKLRNIAMAYYPDGTPKRCVGTFYLDMGCTYTQEMYNEDHGIFEELPKKKRKKHKK